MDSARQTVYPSLAYEDAEGAIAWLTDAFEFALSFSVLGEGGGVLHAELTTPGSAVIMVLSTEHSTRRGRSPQSLGGTAQSVYVAVSDPDAVRELAVRAGAEVFNPPHDTDHGREFCCHDPEGHIWTFGTYSPRP